MSDTASTLIPRITAVPLAYRGFWQPVMYQPDLRSLQMFAVGVITHWRGELRAVRLLNEFEKFNCIYGDRLAPQLVSLSFARVSALLGTQAAASGRVPQLHDISPHWSLGGELTCAGDSPQEVVDRLFDTVVAMKPEVARLPKKEFESRDIVAIRKDLHPVLKMRMGTRFEAVVQESGYIERAMTATRPARKYRVDIKTSSCVAAICTAWYASSATVEHSLLMPYVDVQALSDMDQIGKRALFVARPLNNALIDPRQAEKIDEFLTEMGDKLTESGWVFEVDEDFHRLADAIADFSR